jgi:hypothetical protein
MELPGHLPEIDQVPQLERELILSRHQLELNK